MQQGSPGEEKLEALLQNLLSNTPLRRAPASLAPAVMAEIERRARLPWWRKSFAQWPASARIVFVLLSLALIVLTVLAGSVREFGASPLSLAHGGISALSATSGVAGIFIRLIPSQWLYAGLLLGTLLYVLLFGLGAFAYRTLYLAPLQGQVKL